jgi:hypothetical protein
MSHDAQIQKHLFLDQLLNLEFRQKYLFRGQISVHPVHVLVHDDHPEVHFPFLPVPEDELRHRFVAVVDLQHVELHGVNLDPGDYVFYRQLVSPVVVHCQDVEGGQAGWRKRMFAGEDVLFVAPD